MSLLRRYLVRPADTTVFERHAHYLQPRLRLTVQPVLLRAAPPSGGQPGRMASVAGPNRRRDAARSLDLPAAQHARGARPHGALARPGDLWFSRALRTFARSGHNRIHPRPEVTTDRGVGWTAQREAALSSTRPTARAVELTGLVERVRYGTRRVEDRRLASAPLQLRAPSPEVRRRQVQRTEDEGIARPQKSPPRVSATPVQQPSVVAIADLVMRQIDRRLSAWRERTGRV